MTSRAPEAFEDAYAALVELVARAASGAVKPEDLGQEADRWRADSCRGAGALARAATNALRHELASRGLAEGNAQDETGIADKLRSLSRIEAVLENGEQASIARQTNGGSRAPEGRIVEVALPEAFRAQHPKARGFRMGELQIIFEPQKLPGGVSNGHLSVSHPSRYPTFEELLEVRKAPGGKVPNLWVWLPKPAEQERMHPYTLHADVLPPRDKLG